MNEDSDIATTPGCNYTIDEALQKAGFGWFQWKVLVLAGVMYAIDASHVLMLTFLIPIIVDLWALDPPWGSLIGVAFFMGGFLGCLIWSKICDIIGRRKIIISTTLLVAVSTFATAFVKDIGCLLVCYFLLGFGNAGVVCTTLFEEFSPMDWRAWAMVFHQACWTAGGIFMVAIAWATVDHLSEDVGWRAYMLVSAVPSLSVFICSLWIPESVRWYYTAGEFDKAENMIQQVFKTNGVQPMEGRLVRQDEISKRGEIRDVFISNYRKTSLALIVSITVGVMVYYGVVFLSERLFRGSTLYFCELITALSEIPAIPIGLLMNKTGRVSMMCITRTVATVCIAVVALQQYYEFAESYVQTLNLILIFCARCACAVNQITIMLYYTEYYPTAIRATAFGLGYAISKFGSAGATYISEDLSIVAAATALAIFCAVSCVATLFITEETTYKKMTDIVDRTDYTNTKGEKATKQYGIFETM